MIKDQPLSHIYYSGIDMLIKRIKMIDPILVRHGYVNEPNIHNRGSDRIDFALCTRLINKFITKRGILPFDQIYQSDHSGIYISRYTSKVFLQDDIVSLLLTSRILSTKSQTMYLYIKQNYRSLSIYKML